MLRESPPRVEGLRNIIIALCVIAVNLATMSLSCSREASVLKLPGQTTPASDLLIKAVREVQNDIGRPVVFLDITTHSDPTVRSARGHYDWSSSREQIWLNPSLSYDDQEAVAAHELAHVLQKAQGYCQTATQRDKNGQAIFPEINLLGTTINSLVTDVMADQWALQRGFKVEEGLKNDALPKALRDVKNKKPDEQESKDWKTYYSTLQQWAKIIESGRQIQGTVILPPEVRTQIRAVGYANLKLRLSPLDLFSELDGLWAEYWPEARRLGIEIADLVEATGTDSKPQCERTTINIIEYLNIPPELVVVKEPNTGEVIWPK